MADLKSQFNVSGDRPWARIGFDIEGIVGALAAWLVGLLLGSIWGPLFWLGLIAAALILLATRRQERTLPDSANLVIAPCDGVVQSVSMAVPPVELRLPATDHLRIRVSSSPASPNTIHSPITGELVSVIEEEPDPSVFFATTPELNGLAVAHLEFKSMDEMVGLRVSTGGFGPRLEIVTEIGDAVRAGRVVGKRRLGGWCDIYLRPDARLLVREGQTLVGSETVLCRLAVEAGTVEDEPVATAVEKSDDDDEQQEDATVDDANEAEDAKTESSDTSEDLSEEEVSEMFEKLKQKADEASQ